MEDNLDRLVEEELLWMVKKLNTHGDKAYANAVFMSILTSKPKTTVVKEYTVLGKKWKVYHGDSFKLTFCEDHHYNCFFNKNTGLNIRFGKEVDDDPACCELGPEILDLEISTGNCPPVKGSSNCAYCYKNNTQRCGNNMSFETFKKIVDSFPANLSQIAFGITGLKSNPDMPKMFAYCREVGIVPNVTTVGVDMDDSVLDVLCKQCGAVAVSCYTGAKELCYKTIKAIHDRAKEKFSRDMHVNMHILVSKQNIEHLRDVLKDIAEGKVDGLKSVVLLRIKPKGRAEKMDCTVPFSMYEELVTYCIDNNISFGFDSCSAVPVMEVLKKIGKPELCTSCEKCESSSLSAYISVDGKYWSCSFAEGTSFIKPIDVLSYESAIDWWNSSQLLSIREKMSFCYSSCPIYNLDGGANG